MERMSSLIVLTGLECPCLWCTYTLSGSAFYACAKSRLSAAEDPIQGSGASDGPGKFWTE